MHQIPEPTSPEFLPYWKNYAHRWAKDLIEGDPKAFVILDTETTGTTVVDEVVEVGAMDAKDVLADNWLVNPTVPITQEAISVHRIDHSTVFNAPTFLDIWDDLRNIICGKTLICYNAYFDVRMLEQSARAFGIPFDLGFKQVQCAMEMYALWNGEWNPKHQSFRWQKLDGGDHSALGDCFATLRLLYVMANGENG